MLVFIDKETSVRTSNLEIDVGICNYLDIEINDLEFTQNWYNILNYICITYNHVYKGNSTNFETIIYDIINNYFDEKLSDIMEFIFANYYIHLELTNY